MVRRRREGGDRGGGGDADAVGDGSPDEAADEQPGGDADDEADGGEGGGLPGDGGAYLSAVETEGFEQGEVAAAAAHGGDERVADGEERESGEESGEGGREPVDLAEAVDFGRDGGSGWAGEVGVGRDAMLDRGVVDAGREADEEVAVAVVVVENPLESRVGEGRAVREWPAWVEARGARLVRRCGSCACGVGAAGLNGVAEVFVEGVQGD